jgi:hypothetical protein
MVSGQEFRGEDAETLGSHIPAPLSRTATSSRSLVRSCAALGVSAVTTSGGTRSFIWSSWAAFPRLISARWSGESAVVSSPPTDGAK